MVAPVTFSITRIERAKPEWSVSKSVASVRVSKINLLVSDGDIHMQFSHYKSNGSATLTFRTILCRHFRPWSNTNSFATSRALNTRSFPRTPCWLILFAAHITACFESFLRRKLSSINIMLSAVLVPCSINSRDDVYSENPHLTPHLPDTESAQQKNQTLSGTNNKEIGQRKSQDLNHQMILWAAWY